MVSDPTTERSLDLFNDTAINVVALLKEPVGAKRSYGLHLDAFRLAEDVRVESVDGTVQLTRLRDQILAAAKVRGGAMLECVRCLRPYLQPVAAEFAEEFRPTVDVRTGAGIDPLTPVDEDEEQFFEIDANHELDLAEPLRQHLLLALPMRPDCGVDCLGPDLLAVGDEDEAADERFAALSALLQDGPAARDGSSDESAGTTKYPPD